MAHWREPGVQTWIWENCYGEDKVKYHHYIIYHMSNTTYLRFSMKLLLVGIVSFAFSASAWAQTGPGKSEVYIDDVVVNGSGCPVGTATAIVTNSTPNGPVDYFQVTFDEFAVERPGKSRKFCNVLLNIKYPSGWSFTVLDVETDGYGEIQKGVKGTFKISYRYRNTNRGRSKSRTHKGYWEGEYRFSDKFAHPVYSECGKVYPLNLKTEIKLTGRAKNGGDSILTVDQQSGLLTQLFGIRWRRC